MTKETEKISLIKVIGQQTKTTNKQEFISGMGKIGPLVGEYFSNQVANKIIHRTHPGRTLAVYSNYHITDKTDPNSFCYTYLIGEEVSEFDEISEDLHCIEIPAGTYLKFTTRKGKMPDVVVNAWQEIWAMDANNSLGGTRTLKADFELYNNRAVDPEKATVDIFIGIQ